MASGTVNIDVKLEYGPLSWRKHKAMLLARVIALGLIPRLAIVVLLPHRMRNRKMRLRFTTKLTRHPERFVHMPGYAGVFNREYVR